MSKNNKSIDTVVVFGASTTFGFVDTSGKGGWAGMFKLLVWYCQNAQRQISGAI